MRLLIVDTMYAGFLADHYERAPGLADEPYGVQWRALMDRFFGTADSYSHYLGELGHPAHEVVIDCVPLQRAWAKEHGVRRWRRGSHLVVAQADELEADVVYVQDLAALDDRTLARLRRGRLLVGQLGTEAPAPERLQAFDLVVTSFPHFVERIRATGVRSEYLRIGFDPRVLERLGPTSPEHGAVFVGSVGGGQWQRADALLEEAARLTDIEFWGQLSDALPAGSPLRAGHHGPAWGLDMFRVLARARVALNRHGDVAEGYANNMRLYEATGVGALLVTDEGANLAGLFEPGREVVTYADADELADKVRHYLEHEEERAAIARAGQQRTLREHTYAARMRDLVQILEAV